jgi:hypothetical protein
MRHEDVAQPWQTNPREDQLSRDAVTAIDDVSDVVDHDHLRRGRTGLARSRATTRSEQDQSALAAVLVALADCERGKQ